MNHENTLKVARKIIVESKVDDETFSTLCCCLYRLTLAIDLLNSPITADNPEKMQKYKNSINEELATIAILGLQ